MSIEESYPLFSDHYFVEKALTGQKECFAELVKKHKNGVYTILLRMIHDPEEAYDLSQETFLKAYKNLARYNMQYTFSTWLYRIAINTALDYLKAKKHRMTETFKKLEDVEARVFDKTHGAQDISRDVLLKMEVHDLLNSIPPRYKAVMVLKFSQELTYDEIADILKMPVGTVKMQIHRARAMLFNKMKEQNHDWM